MSGRGHRAFGTRPSTPQPKERTQQIQELLNSSNRRGLRPPFYRQQLTLLRNADADRTLTEFADVQLEIEQATGPFELAIAWGTPLLAGAKAKVCRLLR